MGLALLVTYWYPYCIFVVERVRRRELGLALTFWMLACVQGMNGTLLLLLNPRIRAGPPQLSEPLDQMKSCRTSRCMDAQWSQPLHSYHVCGYLWIWFTDIYIYIYYIYSIIPCIYYAYTKYAHVLNSHYTHTRIIIVMWHHGASPYLHQLPGVWPQIFMIGLTAGTATQLWGMPSPATSRVTSKPCRNLAEGKGCFSGGHCGIWRKAQFTKVCSSVIFRSPWTDPVHFMSFHVASKALEFWAIAYSRTRVEWKGQERNRRKRQIKEMPRARTVKGSSHWIENEAIVRAFLKTVEVEEPYKFDNEAFMCNSLFSRSSLFTLAFLTTLTLSNCYSPQFLLVILIDQVTNQNIL